MTKLPVQVGDEILPNERTFQFATDADTKFLFVPLLNEEQDRTGGHDIVTSNAPFRNHHQQYNGSTNYMEFENNGLDGGSLNFAVSAGFVFHDNPGLAQLCAIGDTSGVDLAWAILINTNQTPLIACSTDGVTPVIVNGGAATVDVDRPNVITFFKYGTTQEVWINGKFGISGTAPATIFNSSANLDIGRNPAGSRHMPMELFWFVVQHGAFSNAQERRSYHNNFLNPNILLNVG